MLVGTHDGNLITNQSFVGKVAGEISGETFIELELKDYLGQPITPTRLKVKLNTYYGESEVDVTQNLQTVIIGHRSGGGIRGIFNLEQGLLRVTNDATTQQIVESMGTIEITEITTQDRTYNEFKFIN